VLQRRVDRDAVLDDALGEIDEGRDAAAPGPAQPAVQQRLTGLALEDEDLPELLFEQVGPEQLVVDLGDPGELGLLPVGEVVESARSAVPAFRPVRFCGPLPAPGVPLSRHRALHKSRHAVSASPSSRAGQGVGICAPR
jgi:hypothetical protein